MTGSENIRNSKWRQSDESIAHPSV